MPKNDTTGKSSGTSEQTVSDIREIVTQKLAAFCAATDFRAAALDFFRALGYGSSRTLATPSFDAFRDTFDQQGFLNHPAALISEWRSAHFLFQLTDENLSGPQSLFDDPSALERARYNSYVFLAVELTGTDYARGKLAAVTRCVNRVFPQPVMVLFKTGGGDHPALTLAVINRRPNKIDAEIDVLSKVTLIRNIDCATPHRGHLDILKSLAVPNLVHPQRLPITSFDALHASWEEIFNVELLRRSAYYAIANWFFWARENIIPPPDSPVDGDGKPSLFLIRLLTRLLFCWFLKEKKFPNGRSLIPTEFFDETNIRDILLDASSTAGTYYTAILQNLFFASLNTEMDNPDPSAPPNRRFSSPGKDDHMVHTLWRHAEQLRDPEALAVIFRKTPFLNGGLFECLDERAEKGNSNYTHEIRADGFASDLSKCPRVPNFLFFGPNQIADLSAATGSASQSAVPVAPLLSILHHYVFTVAENTPLEEEVALDPDLLGNIFENLLASYNPETGTAARNATGSFYTPDYVVNWMVEQALRPTLAASIKTTPDDPRLCALFSAVLCDNSPFSPTETASLIETIDQLKILDPACGSGAFPMGALRKLTHILSILDRGNTLWKQRQRNAADQITDAPAREAAIIAVERAFVHDNGDYGRKLFLIENCLYGADIQPLAVQIAKLRFFITLIVDQSIDPSLPNYGILPLPNLETKIVAANSIITLQRGQLLLGSAHVRTLEKQLKTIRHDYFTARSYPRKKALRKQDREFCKQLAAELASIGTFSTSDADRIARWNPYNTNVAADFFEPEWMFGLSEPFDIIIGNPPYVRQEELKSQTATDSDGAEKPLKTILAGQYESYAGTADLFVYFFERSLQLLKTGGYLSFITSNKYFRSGYGEKLRAYLAHASAPTAIIDFGDTNIFTAVAYPAIFVTRKTHDIGHGQLPDSKNGDEHFIRHYVINQDRQFPVFTWRLGPDKETFPQVFEEQHQTLRQRDLRPSVWRLEGEYDIVLLQRIQKAGTPLKNCCGGRIYYGIKTGCDIFQVDEKTRKGLIANHAASDELLKPFLKGRDIKRWRVNFSDRYLIKIESSENKIHPWSGKSAEEAEIIFKKTYRAIYDYLATGKNRQRLIKRTDQGTYFWELRSCSYWEEFSTQKIVMGRFMDKPTYAFDDEGYYHNDALYFVAGANRFLAAVLNSPVIWYCLRKSCTDLQNGFLQALRQYQEQLPIPNVTPEQQHFCELLAAAIIELNKPINVALPNRLTAIPFFEQWLNGLIYELYFTAELHARNLRIYDLSRPILVTVTPSPHPAPNDITALYNQIADYRHPLRAALNDLQNLEEIQTIESVDKK